MTEDDILGIIGDRDDVLIGTDTNGELSLHDDGSDFAENYKKNKKYLKNRVRHRDISDKSPHISERAYALTVLQERLGGDAGREVHANIGEHVKGIVRKLSTSGDDRAAATREWLAWGITLLISHGVSLDEVSYWCGARLDTVQDIWQGVLADGDIAPHALQLQIEPILAPRRVLYEALRSDDEMTRVKAAKMLLDNQTKTFAAIKNKEAVEQVASLTDVIRSQVRDIIDVS